MAQKIVGVDLGSHHIKVAVLSAGFRGATLVEAFEEPVGAAPPAEDGKKSDPLGHALSVALTVLRARGLLGQMVALSLPASLLSYRILEFPFTDERRIAQAVGFEAEGQFPVPMEQLVHGHLVVPGSGNGGRALVVAAKRDRVEQISALFRRAGTDVRVVTSPAIAAAQVTEISVPPMAAGDRALQPAALLLDLGHQFTHFVAIGPKGPLAVRLLRRGGRHLTQAIASAYSLEVGAAEAAKHTDAFLPHHGLAEHMDKEQLEAGRLVATTLEPIFRELEHTKLWLRGAHRVDVQKILLTGGGADLKGLAEYLAEHTGIEVALAKPGATGLKVAQPGGNYTASLAAIGAAYGAARRPLVQLYQDSGEVSQGAWLQERMPSLLGIGVAVLAFGALDTLAKVRAADAELQAYSDHLASATEKVFGKPLTPAEVDTHLAAAEGQDLTSLIPEKGALDTLALVTKAATPSDLEEAKQKAAVEAQLAAAQAAFPEAEGLLTPDAGESESDSEGGGEEGEGEKKDAAPIGPIAAEAGIVAADELTFANVAIRERKLELEAEANTSSAQDRLASKLRQFACITNISKGKIKGNERRRFEMNIDHDCYRQPAVRADDEAS